MKLFFLIFQILVQKVTPWKWLVDTLRYTICDHNKKLAAVFPKDIHIKRQNLSLQI